MCDFKELNSLLKGEVKVDTLHQIIYATDASAYREMPMGVVYPEDREEVGKIIGYAKERQLNLIPRAGGTGGGKWAGRGRVAAHEPDSGDSSGREMGKGTTGSRVG